MLLFYIRHGDPIYDPDSLTPLGKRQAEAVAKRLALYGIDRLYASSSTRAIETARPTSEITKKDMTILDWCNESHAWREMTVTRADGAKTWCFADESMRRTFSRADVRALGRKWYEHPAFADTTFAQGIQRIQTEADAFLKSLGYAHNLEENRYEAERPNDERVALFAHQGFGLAFLSCVLDVPYPILSTHFDMTHSGMTVIEFANRAGSVIPCALTLSDDAHIYREGLPTRYENRVYF